MPVLSVRNLEVSFGPTRILRGVNFEVEAGETLGVVGESGCGKSMTAYALMNMIPGIGKISPESSIELEGRELTKLTQKEWLDVRGSQIGLVMQDPFTSLNPMMRVGDQIAEALVLHKSANWREARQEAVNLLGKVGVPSPETSVKKYPHQMSGGQRQRVVIAIAFACGPKVLVCDEPTTALDVTLQAQILRLIRELQVREKTAVILVSHDIGAIGAISDRVAVFYAGQVIEIGEAKQVLHSPSHPYTQALLNALPRANREELATIQGAPPDFANLPIGCSFAPRCPFREERCQETQTLLEVDSGHAAACVRARELFDLAAHEPTKDR